MPSPKKKPYDADQKAERFFKDLMLPRNLEAEQSLFCAILLDNDVLPDILETLTTDDFYTSAHRRIFDGCKTLFADEMPVDLVTLNNILKDDEALAAAGGAGYLASLIDFVPTAVNVSHYAQIVREKAVLRRLVRGGAAIMSRGLENGAQLPAILDFAEKTIFDLAADKMQHSYIRIGDLLQQRMEEMERQERQKTLVVGVPTGFRDIDSLTLGFQPSDLVILAARPGMGKTTLALNIAQHAAMREGVGVGLFSLEMSKEQLALRLLSAESRVDSYRMKCGFMSRDDWDAVTDAASRLADAPIYIDDTPGISEMTLRAKARRLKMKENIGLILVDYLQLMKASQKADRRDLEVAETSSALKALAKDLAVPVVVLSQLNRKPDERQDKRPKLGDLRESGAIEQDADQVLFIYREAAYQDQDDSGGQTGQAEIILAKNRNGPVGTARLTFLSTYTRFENLTAA